MKAWTDYPFLPDEPTPAPIREIEILNYDRDKYCTIMFKQKRYLVKRAYLYRQPATRSYGKPVARWKLRFFLPRTDYRRD